MATPGWNAARNGTLNDGGAQIKSAQVNQFLGTHAPTYVYPGASILTPNGTGATNWGQQLSTLDVDQPFTMSGTVIGRVSVPLLPVGNGADLLVSLCADSSGSPGTVLQQTRIPKEWISQLSAVSGTPATALTAPNFELTNNPLALAQFYTFQFGATASSTWPYPTGSGTFYAAGFGTPGFFLGFGGVAVGGTTASANTYSIPVSLTGTLLAAIPQPALPAALYWAANATFATDAISGNQYAIVLGGSPTSSSSGAVSTVYVSQYTSGSLAAWSSQQTLPGAGSAFPMAASWNGYVYFIGGDDVTAGNVNTVYYAQLQNGQISAWTATTSLPLAVEGGFAVALNGFLYVFSGIGNSGNLTTTWYAPINANGTLGNWVTAPTMPFFTGQSTPGAASVFGSYGMATSSNVGKQAILSTGPNGPDYAYAQHTNPHGAEFYGANPGAQPGQWYVYGPLFGTFVATVYSTPVSLTPRISVPLPITGLSNGTTYHILLQQQGGDAADYLLTHLDTNAFPSDPTALTSARNAYSWTALTPSGTCVPIQIYDGAAVVSGPQVLPLHTWEDNGSRISTLVSATTPDQRLLGICEATIKGKPLNTNPGFEFTINPWGTSTGTLVRSNTQAYDSNWSAQLTPNGTSAAVFMQSENLPCLPGQSITVSMWVYAVNTITANFSGTLFWYNAAGTFLSESDNLVTITAATWTNVTNTFTAPTGAYQFSINPRQSGTPPVGNVFYVDDAYAYPTYAGEQFATVQEITWAGAWPNNVNPPTGVTQLA